MVLCYFLSFIQIKERLSSYSSVSHSVAQQIFLLEEEHKPGGDGKIDSININQLQHLQELLQLECVFY